MKSTILDAKLGVGGKLFSSFYYNQDCSEVSIHVILLWYMCTCHIMVKEQRKVVIEANEMHYFKLKSVRNWYIPHFFAPVWNTNNFVQQLSYRSKTHLWSFNTRNPILVYFFDFEKFFNVWLYTQIAVKLGTESVTSRTIYFLNVVQSSNWTKCNWSWS